MITGTYRWWWYNGEVKKGSDVCGGYLWHFQRMCWRIQAVAGIPYWVSHIPNWRQTHRTISSSCHRRSFPIASNSTREMPKKDRIHPFFQAWVGVSRTQRLRRLRHGAMSQVLSHPTSSDMIDTWSKPNAGPGNNYQSQANHPYFPIFVWLDSTFFSAIYSDLTLVAGRKQLASPWERSCRRPKP